MKLEIRKDSGLKNPERSTQISKSHGIPREICEFHGGPREIPRLRISNLRFHFFLKGGLTETHRLKASARTSTTLNRPVSIERLLHEDVDRNELRCLSAVWIDRESWWD